MRMARLAAVALLMAATVVAPGSATGEHRGGRWERYDRYELEQGLRRLEEIGQRRLEIEESRRSQELEERTDRDRQERRQRWELKETWPTGPLDLDRCRTDRGYVECQP